MTTPLVPGCRVTKVIGLTYGLVVRSHGLGRTIVAGFRVLGGGEITESTQLLEQARHEARMHLEDHARTLGANVVVSVSFDTSEMGEVMSEILAYGTGVVVEADSAMLQPVALR